MKDRHKYLMSNERNIIVLHRHFLHVSLSLYGGNAVQSFVPREVNNQAIFALMERNAYRQVGQLRIGPA
jgi:hypothetical protein